MNHLHVIQVLMIVSEKVKFEDENERSVETLYFLFRAFEKSGAVLIFCGVCESCIIVEGALLEAS